MSYEILYDTAFIKTSRGFLPMILSGSNNCYDVKRDRMGRRYEARERHWWAFCPRPLTTDAHPLETALGIIQSWVEEAPDSEFFWHRGSFMHYKDWPKWYTNACQRALTLEEYLETNASQSFEAALTVYPKGEWEKSKMYYREYPRMSEELDAWLLIANIRAEEFRASGNTVDIRLSFLGDEPLRHLPKVVRDNASPVLVKHRNSYLKAYKPGRSLSFSPNIDEAVVFPSAAEANEVLGTHWKDLKFVSAKAKDKSYVVRTNEGKWVGWYFAQKTAKTFRHTFSKEEAHRFKTKSAAKQYAKATVSRFNIGHQFVVVNLKTGEEEAFSV